MGPGGSWCRCGRRGRSGCQAGPRGPAREIVRRIVALRGPAKNRRDSTWVPVIILVISSGANALGWIPFKVDIRSGVRREFAGAVRIKCPYVADFEQEHRTLPGGRCQQQMRVNVPRFALQILGEGIQCHAFSVLHRPGACAQTQTCQCFGHERSVRRFVIIRGPVSLKSDLDVSDVVIATIALGFRNPVNVESLMDSGRGLVVIRVLDIRVFFRSMGPGVRPIHCVS